MEYLDSYAKGNGIFNDVKQHLKRTYTQHTIGKKEQRRNMRKKVLHYTAHPTSIKNPSANPQIPDYYLLQFLSLLTSLASMSAPCCRRALTHSTDPLRAA